MMDDAVVSFSAGSLMLLNGILAVVMFSIAIDLKPSDFRAFTKAPKPLIVGLLSQFVLLPVLTYLLVIVVQPQASVALGLILVAACPGGNISNFITHRAGGNTALSVSMTAFSTVGAILLTPFNIAFWGSLYAPSASLLRSTQIDPVNIAITVGLMLILPLILGITLQQTPRPDRPAARPAATDVDGHFRGLRGHRPCRELVHLSGLCRWHRGAGDGPQRAGSGRRLCAGHPCRADAI